MADTGRVQKTYDLYIDSEEVDEAISKGEIVCWKTGASEGVIKKVDTSLDNQPPYG